MKDTLSTLVFVVLMALAPLSNANTAAPIEPLVSPAWVAEHLNDEGLVLLDIRPLASFIQGHIPGSVQTDYAAWRRPNADGVKKMLPSQTYLERLLGSLGIDQDAHVVIVPLGKQADELAAATRIFWTLHVAGLDKLSILNGGLLAYWNAYQQQGIVRGTSAVESKIVTLTMRADQTPGIDAVKQALAGNHTIVDTRSPKEFLGKTRAPGERPGAMPRAVNLPFDSLTIKRSGIFPSTDVLKGLFEQSGVPLEGEQVAYCHTGHRAALVWFVSHELLGNKQARLYDGSMLEWASTPGLPVIKP